MANILPTERLGIFLDKKSIVIVVVVVVVVLDFSETHLRCLAYLLSRVETFRRFRQRSKIETSRRRLFIQASFIAREAGSGKTFCRKSEVAFIRVFRVISISLIFLRNLTHFS